MAIYDQPTPEQEKDYDAWVEDRPAVVRDIAQRFKPWILYRMQSTGQRVIILGFSEDGKLSVAVTGRFNLVNFERNVFGIDPNDLVECDLPAEGEPLGVMMTQEQANENIDTLRLRIRPDLWKLLPNGKVVRR